MGPKGRAALMAELEDEERQLREAIRSQRQAKLHPRVQDDEPRPKVLLAEELKQEALDAKRRAEVEADEAEVEAAAVRDVQHRMAQPPPVRPKQPTTHPVVVPVQVAQPHMPTEDMLGIETAPAPKPSGEQKVQPASPVVTKVTSHRHEVVPVSLEEEAQRWDQRKKALDAKQRAKTRDVKHAAQKIEAEQGAVPKQSAAKEAGHKSSTDDVAQSTSHDMEAASVSTKTVHAKVVPAGDVSAVVPEEPTADDALEKSAEKQLDEDDADEAGGEEGVETETEADWGLVSYAIWGSVGALMAGLCGTVIYCACQQPRDRPWGMPPKRHL